MKDSILNLVIEESDVVFDENKILKLNPNHSVLKSIIFELEKVTSSL